MEDGQINMARADSLVMNKVPQMYMIFFYPVLKLDINTATFFAMSSENMNRPKEETEFISILLDNSIKKHLQDLLDNQIKFTVIGDLSHLPENIKNTIEYAETVTSKFTKYRLNIAYNYGGQWDVVNSINTLLSKKLAISMRICLNISQLEVIFLI